MLITKDYLDSLFEEDFSEDTDTDEALDKAMNKFIDLKDSELEVIEAFHAIDMAEIAGIKKINALREEAIMTGKDNDNEIKYAEDEIDSVMEGLVTNAIGKIANQFEKVFQAYLDHASDLGHDTAELFIKNKKFIEEYEPKVKALKNKTITVKLYEYPIKDKITWQDPLANGFADMTRRFKKLTVDNIQTVDMGKLKRHDVITKYKLDINSVVPTLMTKKVDLNLPKYYDTDDSNIVSSSAISMAFYGKQKDTTVNVEHLLKVVKSDDTFNTLKQLRTDIRKGYKNTYAEIKSCEEYAKELLKKGTDRKSVNGALHDLRVMTGAFQMACSLNIHIITAWRNAHISRLSEYKRAIKKACK